DRLAREIATEVAAAPDHAAEIGLHGLRAEVRDVDPDSAVGAAPSLLDLGEARARDEIAGGALHPRGVVAAHEALARAVEQAAAPEVEEEGPARAAGAVAEKLHCAVLLESPDGRARPHLLGETVHDLDAREIAFVNRAVVGLAGEGLLVDAAIGVAVEEAAVAILELPHASRRLRHQRPHQLLVIDPAAARQGVEE